jgi:hypothetical protein
MKLRLLAASLVTLMAGASFAADLGTMRLKTAESSVGTLNLKDCNGSLEISKTYLYVVGNDNCSNVVVNGSKVKATEGLFSGVRKALVDLYSQSGKENIYDITIKSNSGKTSDSMTIIIDDRPVEKMVVLYSNQSASLKECGGTVEFKVTNGQANLIFRDIKQCSNFDILSANGEKTDYPNKKIGTEENRSASFTLPKSIIDFGANGVTVIVKSNSGKTSDKIKVKFLAL